MSFYNTIEQESMAEFKDRGSRFLAYAYPFTYATKLKKYLQKQKKDHAKVAHFCFAYRLGTGSDNFRSSDGGEPSGTAGKPILGQIDSKQLTDANYCCPLFRGYIIGSARSDKCLQIRCLHGFTNCSGRAERSFEILGYSV